MEQKIKSVQKGYGEGDIFYSTDTRVAKQYQVEEIRYESKQVSPDIIFNVYRGYITDENYLNITGLYAVYMENGAVKWEVDIYDMFSSSIQTETVNLPIEPIKPVTALFKKEKPAEKSGNIVS